MRNSHDDKLVPTPDRNGFIAITEQLLILVASAVVGWMVGRTMHSPKRKPGATLHKASPTSASSFGAGDLSTVPQAQSFSEIPGHEKFELGITVFGALLVILVLGAFVIHTSLWWWLGFMERPAPLTESTGWQAAARRASESEVPFPKLQISPQTDLRGYLAKQEQELHSYPHLNSTAGNVRVPIERSMELLVQTGLPQWHSTNQSLKPISPLELQQRRAREAQEFSK